MSSDNSPNPYVIEHFGFPEDAATAAARAAAPSRRRTRGRTGSNLRTSVAALLVTVGLIGGTGAAAVAADGALAGGHGQRAGHSAVDRPLH